MPVPSQTPGRASSTASWSPTPLSLPGLTSRAPNLQARPRPALHSPAGKSASPSLRDRAPTQPCLPPAPSPDLLALPSALLGLPCARLQPGRVPGVQARFSWPVSSRLPGPVHTHHPPVAPWLLPLSCWPQGRPPSQTTSPSGGPDHCRPATCRLTLAPPPPHPTSAESSPVAVSRGRRELCPSVRPEAPPAVPFMQLVHSWARSSIPFPRSEAAQCCPEPRRSTQTESLDPANQGGGPPCRAPHLEPPPHQKSREALTYCGAAWSTRSSGRLKSRRYTIKEQTGKNGVDVRTFL